MEHFYKNIGEDWFSYPNLYKSMVQNAKQDSHFVEVGVWKGRSASYMAVEIINSGKKIKFDCVDHWLGSIEHREYGEVKEKKLYDVFLQNIDPVKDVINPIQMNSYEASLLYEDNSLDFVFIDASHEYDDVKQDILSWLPKVKKGGVLAGHDYSSAFPSVCKAVDEIFESHQIKVDEFCWVYNKPLENKFYNIDEQRFWNDDTNWTQGGHEWSTPFGTTENLWNKHLFDDLKEFRNKKILEIAPGHGRITQFLSILAKELIVVDLNSNCIKNTKEKLGHHVLAYFVNNGNDLPNIRNNSQDLVYSYDSFVHMHRNVIEDYLKEIQRVLVEGGKGIIHHSNLWQGKDYSFQNTAGRSNMTIEVFKELVEKFGMRVIEQKPITFEPLNGWSGTDYITIFQK